MSSSNTSFPTGGGIAGVNVANTTTTADFKLGHKVDTNDGVYEFVQATADIAQFDAVVIGSGGQATSATTTLAATIKKVGFAQVAITSGTYGWVAREGDNIKVKLAANTATGVQLYTTATSGVLGSTVVSQGAVHGVVTLVSISTATNAAILAANPHVGFGSGN